MPLDDVQAREAWQLFKDSPLLANWPEIENELALKLSPRYYQANDVIFEPGVPADYLYLVRRGSVLQTIRHNGHVWFHRRLEPGQFFGQHSLFTGRHHTRTVATDDTDVFVMTAADLRQALERNTSLRESLLRDRVASRLRSVPLFQCMEDEDISWLTLLVDERTYEQHARIPVDTETGAWVIDYGLVRVSGPAAGGVHDWRLTAGNFFMSVDESNVLDTAAGEAEADLKSRLFLIPTEHLRRVTAAFPEVAHMLAQRVDIEGWLMRARGLQGIGVTEAHLRHLAQFCAWDFVPAGQNITTQGNVGYSFVVLCRGSALVSAVDNEGRLRPRNLLRAGDAFGTTSLLESKPRDATVRAVMNEGDAGEGCPGTEILNLDRRDLTVAFSDEPQLWGAGVWLFDRYVRTRETRYHYPWQEEGELVVWEGRRHWLWLFGPEALVVGGFALAVAVAITVAGMVLGESALNIAVLIAVGLIFLPIVAWAAINYFDDYYVVTNRRVTRRDRRLLVWESREDAPLEMVQDVTVDSDLLGRIFDFGKVGIRTAAKVGVIIFDNVPQPDEVKSHIMQEKAGVAAAARGHVREMLRSGLLSNLQLALPIPDLDVTRALGPDAQPHQVAAGWRRLRDMLFTERKQGPQVLPGTRRPKPKWFTDLLKPLPPRVQHVLIGPPPPPVPPMPGQIVWRKHWLNLFQRASVPVIALLVLTALIGGAIALPGPIMTLAPPAIVLGLLVLWLVALGWFAWEYTDYRNDIYVLTDEKLVDIERKPLGLRSERRETTLDRVQNVTSEQPGFWSNVLNYGNVVIRTAAADSGFTFEMVAHPQNVQRTIFQKVDAYRRKQEEKSLAQRQRDMIEGLQVYHEMRQEREWGMR